jgi:hypothetical protein
VSTTFFTWTFPSYDCGTSDFLPLESVWVHMEKPEAAGQILSSASRNMWLTGTLAHITSHLGISTLMFVSEVDGTLQRDPQGHRWVTYMLDHAAVVAASAGIEQLLKCAAEEPEHFAGVIGRGGYGGYTAAEILQALESSSPVYDPISGPQGEEEGDGPLYFFAYLKCLLSLLRHAQAQGLCVMHVRHMH